MPALDPASLHWAVDAAAPGADVTEVRGLRDGDSPWLIRLTRYGQDRSVVLRVGAGQDPSTLPTEIAALRLAAEHKIPAPRLLAADLDRNPPLVLVEQLSGSSTIPRERPSERLRTLGRTAAMLHAILLDPSPALPQRDRPIASVDFAALRRQHPPSALLMEAEQRAEEPPPHDPNVFIHGDLWQGNARHRPRLPPLRRRHLLRPRSRPRHPTRLEEAAGRPASEVPYWDLVAALSTPPDMGWFPAAIAGQGRPDLTQAVLLRRRDAFLQAALRR